MTTGRPGRRRPSRSPASMVSARIRRICERQGTLDYLDIQRVHPLQVYDIRLPSSHRLRIDRQGRWVDVHTRYGERIIGLGITLCPADVIEHVVVPVIIPLCSASVAVPIEPDECAVSTPDETYLLSEEEREALDDEYDPDA